MCILIYDDLCFELWSLYFHAHYNAYLNISLCLAAVLLVMTSIWLLGSICQLLASPMEEREGGRLGERRQGSRESRRKEAYFFHHWPQNCGELKLEATLGSSKLAL